MALTAPQILDIRGDLNLGPSGSATEIFSDAELNRLFERAASDYNTAVYYGWLQILGGSAAWVKYRVAQTEVSRGDAFDHIKAMVELWGKLATTGANQIRIVGANEVPTRYKPAPADDREYPNRPRRWATRWGW